MGALVPKARFLPPFARQAIAKQMPRGAFAHGQTLLLVEAIQLLPVHLPALTPQQDMQTPVSKPSALR
jgi:hypothetical protein